MSRRLLVLIGALVVLLAGASLVSGYSFVIYRDRGITTPSDSATKEKTFRILDGMNLNEGTWTAYLIIGNDDLSRLPSGVTRRSCLRLTDQKLIGKLRDDWRMRATGGDVATITSAIVFTQNGHVRWESGIDITDGEGLQSAAFGWAEPVVPGVMRRYATYFEPVYWPVFVIGY